LETQVNEIASASSLHRRSHALPGVPNAARRRDEELPALRDTDLAER
jgi:hypothetical protein